MYCVLLLHGCITPVRQDAHYPPTEAGKFTPAIKAELFAEQAVLRERGEDMRIGLAISGGGVRASSFAIGALSGLQNSGALDRVDAISTVSGGGYATYWFMNSLYEAQKSGSNAFRRELLFRDCPDPQKNFCPQRYLSERTDLIFFYRNEYAQYGELAGRLLAQAPSLILHHAANTLFDWRINSSLMRKYYQNSIERTYGLIPESFEPTARDEARFSNGDTALGITDSRARELSFENLHDATLQSWDACPIEVRDKGQCVRMPLWIINMTGGVNYLMWDSKRQPLNRTVFTMTPFGYGSGEFGYVNGPPSQMSVAKAVSVAGAAVDAHKKQSKSPLSLLFETIESAFNINLGYTIYNYNPQRANIAAHWLLPWPLYYMYGYSQGRDATDIYLSDGGNSENLGAYSLIIRGLQSLIIVDAEHDSGGQFSALGALKKQLEKEGLYLSFYTHNASNGPQAKKDFNAALVRAGNQLGNDEHYDPHDTRHSVLHLKVTGFQPGYVSSDPAWNFVDIFYVKASLERSLMDASKCQNNDEAANDDGYPCNVITYYWDKNYEKDRLTPKSGDNLFPQHKTLNSQLAASPEYYRAYRDLAAYYTRHIRPNGGEHLCYSAKDGSCMGHNVDYW